MPDVTWIEVRPAADPHAASSWVVLWPDTATAVELAPWSEPENEPVTLAVSPVPGSLNPSPPAVPVVPP